MLIIRVLMMMIILCLLLCVLANTFLKLPKLTWVNQGLKQLYSIYEWDFISRRLIKVNRGYCSMLFLLAFISACMSVENYMTHSNFMLLTTLVLMTIFILCLLAALKGMARWIVSDIVVFVTCAVFTVYMCIGGNQGFAIYWILLLPIALMLFFNLYIGTLAGIYFLIVIVLFFWCGFQQHFRVVYMDEVQLRFPILYLCSFLMSCLGCISIKHYQMEGQSHLTDLQSAVEQERQSLKNMYRQMILAISSTVDAKDVYTHQHSMRVANQSVRIAERLGWSEEKLKTLFDVALLHDIGKIGIDNNILNKEGRLNEIEYEQLRAHVLIGGIILKDVHAIEDIKEGVLYHHEKYNGSGYPFGIYGEQIPLNARIISIADAIDAMDSDRVYRKRLSKEQIVNELIRCRGEQFDPMLTDTVLELIASGKYELGKTVVSMRDTILVIDDMKPMQDIMQSIFGKEYNVLMAGNGLEALAVLEVYENAISVILLDLLMPEMNGLQFLENMNRNKKRDIPIVIIAGENSQDLKKQIARYDIRDVIVKPFDERIIKIRVENAIRVHNMFLD